MKSLGHSPAIKDHQVFHVEHEEWKSLATFTDFRVCKVLMIPFLFDGSIRKRSFCLGMVVIGNLFHSFHSGLKVHCSEQNHTSVVCVQNNLEIAFTKSSLLIKCTCVCMSFIFIHQYPRYCICDVNFLVCSLLFAH